jgi:hypothetical protein
MTNFSKLNAQLLLGSLVLAGLCTFFVTPAKAVVQKINGFSTQNGDGTWNCDCTGGSGCQCVVNLPPPRE